ncbi:MAG: hypothetical protein SF187_11795 [Deltaproteobacteria bacterium]|nr:hypothetical protein [Deltaproteobacteria bacterium]
MKSLLLISTVACTLLPGLGRLANAQPGDGEKAEPKWIDQTVEQASAPVPPAAELRAPRFEGGLMLGGYLLGRDLELGVPDRPGFVPGPRTLNGIVGLRLSVEALRTLSIEIETGIAPTKDREDGLAATLWLGRLHAVIPVDVDGFFAKQHFRPFLLGGVGFASVVSTDGRVDALGNVYGLPRKDTDAEFHLGAGIKWDPHELVTLRSDIRIYQMPNTKSQGITPTWEIAVGASFKFARAWGRKTDAF